MIDEAAEEVLDQFRLQITHQTNLHLVLVNQRRPSAEIQGNYRERFIHGHHEITRAIDPLAIPERFGDKLSEHYADVLHRVVLIDIQIAHRLQLEIKTSVLGKELEHMIEKANAGRDFVAAPALDL